MNRSTDQRPPYKPVPVEAAAQIAEQFEKSVVIVCAWDPKHGLLHTTTYGVGGKEKVWAAQGGEIAARALGGVPELGVEYADWRMDRIRALEEALRLALRAQMPERVNR